MNFVKKAVKETKEKVGVEAKKITTDPFVNKVVTGSIKRIQSSKLSYNFCLLWTDTTSVPAHIKEVLAKFKYAEFNTSDSNVNKEQIDEAMDDSELCVVILSQESLKNPLLMYL